MNQPHWKICIQRSTYEFIKLAASSRRLARGPSCHTWSGRGLAQILLTPFSASRITSSSCFIPWCSASLISHWSLFSRYLWRSFSQWCTFLCSFTSFLSLCHLPCFFSFFLFSFLFFFQQFLLLLSNRMDFLYHVGWLQKPKHHCQSSIT